MTRRQTIVGGLTAVLVLVSATVLVWSAVATSSARLSATTESESFFAAGRVVLDQPETRVELLFDDDRMFPGRVVTGCVLVSYEGDLPASVRLHGQVTDGTGLDQFIDMRIARTESCAGEPPSTGIVFEGRLTDLGDRHGTYADGRTLLAPAGTGDRVAVWATAEVVDDNDAQGLDTTFVLTVEARP